MNARFVHGVFDTESGVVDATCAAREGSFSIVDVYSPYAIHGIDKAMGLRPSRLTWVCFLAGLLGVALILYFQFWTSAIDWPINVGGKPFNSLPAFVPIAFEITVLFAGLGVVAALFMRCRLFPGKKGKQPEISVTDDRFVLLLRLEGAQRTVEEARALLNDHGAESVSDYVEEDAR